MTTKNVDRVIALVGRPNAGKSSLYNLLTDGDAHVGNYPGITVDVLEADVTLASGKPVTIADLPGLYSLTSVVDKDTDEGVARKFVEDARKQGKQVEILQVIDATQLSLSLKMTSEILGLGVPLIVVITQKDVAESHGVQIDVPMLEKELGVRVLYVSARDPGAKAAVLLAIDKDERTQSLAPKIQMVTLAKRATSLRPGQKDAERRRSLTSRADAILLHPALGPFVFLSIMALTFAAVFLVADPASAAMDWVLEHTRAFIVARTGHGLVASFFVDGLLGGAGTVLAFMPQIVILTIAMEVLEASGYLARGAFLVDRLLRLLGLSGRSFLPLLMAHACAVPAIASTRVIRDPKERLTTILVLPLMTCSARIPTYGLVLAAFFGHKSALFRAGIFVILYFVGVLLGLIASLVLRKTASRGKSLPLVLEMPAYRVPQARLVLHKGKKAATRFLRDVGTTILGVSAVLWVLLTVPMPGAHDPPDALPIEKSIAAHVGKAVEPITRPAGFDWRIDVGLIGSFGAREVMVGTMGVIFGIEKAEDDVGSLATRIREAKHPDGTNVYDTRSGLALLAFFVIACQCMSTVAAIKRETKSLRWPAFVLAYTYALAYVAAVVTYNVTGLVMGL
jgi:ferrous iron transport protein B